MDDQKKTQALTVLHGEVVPWDAAHSLETARLPDVTVAFVSARALKILTAPTPPEVIKKRKGPGGRMLDYVPHGWYRARLNEAFGWDWDWLRDEVRIDLDNDTILFFGHLVIRIRNPLTGAILTTLRKSGEGGAVIQRFKSDAGGGAVIDMGNDVKSASSEAFKRACLNLGLGLDLYWRDEEAHDDSDGREGKRSQGNRRVGTPPPPVTCIACSKPISDGTDSRGKRFTAAAIQKAAEEMFGKALCMECFRKTRAENCGGSQAPASQIARAGHQTIAGRAASPETQTRVDRPAAAPERPG